MSRTNPIGHPLSGPSKRGAVTYRPRVGKKRPRVRVPKDVADKLEDEAKQTTAVRRQVARAAADEHKAKSTSERKAKPKKQRKAAAPRKAPKKRTDAAPRQAPKKRAKRSKVPAVATVARALDVSKTAAKDIVACAADKRKARPKRAKKETGQGDLFAKINPCKAPISLAKLQVAADLGDVVELSWNTPSGYRERFKASKKVTLLWSPAAKAIFFITQKTRRVGAGDVADGAARAVAKRWTGRAPSDAHTLIAPGLLKSSTWKKLGKGHAITYRSDRAGPMEPHEHDLEAGVSVFKNGNLWVVCGGKLRVTSRGLEG